MNDLDRLSIQNSGIRKTLDAIVPHLIDNQEILVKIGKQVDEIAESIAALSKRLEALEQTQQNPLVHYSVFGWRRPGLKVIDMVCVCKGCQRVVGALEVTCVNGVWYALVEA